ncbi:nucleotide exchange factor GrpE [Candidatus Kaiserbacteria bacterium]|nr:nucleotide exchange factor GrpE [Candidatus Kaiserbacteria bacterium]
MDTHSDDTEHIDFEPEDEVGAVGAVQAKMQKLKDELATIKSERQEYLDGWQRCKADAINAKKELALDMQRALLRGKESMAEDLLPVLDSFDMAAGSESWLSVDENWRAGMEQVRNQLLDVLARYGIERFGKIGDAFDPYIHEAVQELDDVAGESNTIARILRYGYKSSSRVIRPAQVIIKK